MEFIAEIWPSDIPETFHQDIHQVKSTPIQVQKKQNTARGDVSADTYEEKQVLRRRVLLGKPLR